MNKYSYRIVFNKTRGLLMAVAETVSSASKQAGTSGAPSVRSMLVRVRPLSFSILLAFGLVGTVANAQIVADPSVPRNQQPTVLNTANGVPLVNIQTPSAAGVSHNVYGQFDVNQQGAILNNARNNTQTQLGGYVQGNPWLATGTARVILNEVNASNPSQLRGYVEVAGDRAQVVIANPAGVSCDGCGFINANRVTLTSGTPILNGGNLDGYRVQNGVVSITGGGLDTSRADYTDIIARAVLVNAGIWANTLKVSAGNSEVSADHSQFRSIASTGAAPPYGIDVASLGGMYAGKITLVGTEAGMGVRNAGLIGASAGNVVVTAGGRLENSGQIMASADLSTDTQSGYVNRGTTYAQGDTQLSTRGHIDNAGTIAALGNVLIAATGDGSSLTSHAGSVIGAGVQSDGSLAGSGSVRVNTTAQLAAHGQNLASGDIVLESSAVNVAGSQTSARNVSLRAGSGDVDVSRTTVSATQILAATATGTLRTDGASASAQRLLLSAHDVSNVRGELVQTGSGYTSIQLPGTLDNTDGRIASNGTGLSLDAQTINNTAGRIEHAGTGGLKINAVAINGARGNIVSNGTLHLTAQSTTLDAGHTIATKLQIDTDTLSNRGGKLLQTGSEAGSVRATSLLDNTGGSLISNGDTMLSASNLINQGGVLQSAGGVTLTSAGLNNRGGNVQAMGNIIVDASNGSVNNGSGLIRSGATLDMRTGNIVNTSTQGINQGLEGQNVTLMADLINNQSGAIRADQTLTLTGSGTLNNMHGLISAGRRVQIQDRNLASKTQHITNTNGTLIAGETLSIDSANLSGDGRVLSQGNLSLNLDGDFTNTGEVQANGNLTLASHGRLTNQSTVKAGNTIKVLASNIDNTASGEISATTTQINAMDMLTNRGLIDGGTTHILAGQLDNLGTGRIYGDHVAIQSTVLGNDMENGTAATIAARNRLDLGVQTLTNHEHALIFSGGDIAIGGALDVNRLATRAAVTVNNNSASIEALGNLMLTANQVNNTNEHFSTGVQQSDPEYIVEYQGSGSPNRYKPDTPGVYTYDDESLHLRTLENKYERWNLYAYNRTTTTSVIASSDPSKINAGGTMRIDAGTVFNDKSQIVAGGAFISNIDNLRNTDVLGQQTVTDTGTVTSIWRQHNKGRDSTGSSSTAYTPPEVISEIRLTPTVYKDNTASNGSGTQIGGLTVGSVSQTTQRIGTVNVPLGNGQAVRPVTEVALVNGTSGGQALVVRTSGSNTALPDNAFFKTNPNPTGHYLIETDPRFANYRTWLSSDYMLTQLSLDPALAQKRLGDGFYEQKLVREQVAQLTGRRFLDGYSADEAQYRALIDNGVTYAKALNLRPGVALTAAQMAQLTSDIVWLVEQEVVLPSGQTAKALVPQVYVRVQPGDLDGSGALIAGQSVNLNLSSDLVNQGSIAGRNVTSITAENVKNLGGRISGGNVTVQARTDLDNLGGIIEGHNSLTALAGRDLNVTTTTRSNSNAQGSVTNINRIAGLYVTAPSGGVLVASAGRDLNLGGAQIGNTSQNGKTILAAARDLNLNTVETSNSQSIQWDSNNWRKDSAQHEVVTGIQTIAALRLSAGNDLNARGALVTSEQGIVLATAGNNVNLSEAQSTLNVDEAHQHKGRNSAFSSKTITTQDTLTKISTQGTTLSGETVLVQAGNDINVQSSNVVSSKGTTFTAKNDINIIAATESTNERHFKDEEKSGLFSGGNVGFTIGTQQQSNDRQIISSRVAASTVGATHGDVTLLSGNAYRQKGSAVLAPQGDVTILGKKVEIIEAQQSELVTDETRFRQSGLTVALTGGAISAVQAGIALKDAAKTSGDTRMQALAAAVGGLTAYSAYQDISKAMATGDKSGGVQLSITAGSSRSDSKTTTSNKTAAGSVINAGGQLQIQASGAGANSTVAIRGSNVSASGNALLSAGGKLLLEAAQNSAEQKTRSSNSSTAAGVMVGYSEKGAQFGMTASGSMGRGSVDGADTTWTNTHVNAGGSLILQSGGDMTLKGAVASGQKVVGEVGDKLIIESLQDTNTYRSKDWNTAGNASYGFGGLQGGVSASQAKVGAELISVREQSAIRAGNEGFQIKAKEETHLTGGAISSNQSAIDAGANRLETAALVTGDIANRAHFKAQAISVSAGTDGAGAGGGQKSGLTSSVTTAGVSGAKVKITDTAKQQVLTGQSADTAVLSLNRSVITGLDSSAALTKTWDEQKLKEQVQANAEITQQASKIAINGAIDAYHAMNQSKFVRVLTDDNSKILLDKDGRPITVELSPEQKANLVPNPDGKITVFTNGIFNSPEAAAKYAVQMSELPAGSKVYLVEFPQADSFVGELMVAGYQKMLEGTVLGLTSSTQEIKWMIQRYGESGLNLVGHSRGSMTIGNAMSAVERETKGQSVMGNTRIKFVGPAYNAETAAQQIYNLSGGRQTSVVLQNHADDFVGTLLGWNQTTYDKRPDNSSKPQEWLQILSNAPTVHSCYGTGAASSKCNSDYGAPVSVDIQATNLLRPTVSLSLQPPTQ